MKGAFSLNNPLIGTVRPPEDDESEDFSLLVAFLLVTVSWLFRGFFVALFCLEKQCSGLFRYFFVVFSWLFRGFFVAPILGKFYAYSPWNSLLNENLQMFSPIFSPRFSPISCTNFGRTSLWGITGLKQGPKNQRNVFLYEVFRQPFGSWTSALKIVDVRTEKCIFFLRPR